MTLVFLQLLELTVTSARVLWWSSCVWSTKIYRSEQTLKLLFLYLEKRAGVIFAALVEQLHLWASVSPPFPWPLGPRLAHQTIVRATLRPEDCQAPDESQCQWCGGCFWKVRLFNMQFISNIWQEDIFMWISIFSKCVVTLWCYIEVSSDFYEW